MRTSVIFISICTLLVFLLSNCGPGNHNPSVNKNKFGEKIGLPQKLSSEEIYTVCSALSQLRFSTLIEKNGQIFKFQVNETQCGGKSSAPIEVKARLKATGGSGSFLPEEYEGDFFQIIQTDKTAPFIGYCDSDNNESNEISDIFELNEGMKTKLVLLDTPSLRDRYQDFEIQYFGKSNSTDQNESFNLIRIDTYSIWIDPIEANKKGLTRKITQETSCSQEGKRVFTQELTHIP